MDKKGAPLQEFAPATIWIPKGIPIENLYWNLLGLRSNRFDSALCGAPATANIGILVVAGANSCNGHIGPCLLIIGIKEGIYNSYTLFDSSYRISTACRTG